MKCFAFCKVMTVKLFSRTVTACNASDVALRPAIYEKEVNLCSSVLKR